ncbi:NAD(P)-binding protein [Sistotremastrum suecicum HHB10207 ss-3]|uniref:NAD(P)-binding protein n=1 Tax=Sistotremastrum suecicum HHB10207 ss-3 TaxID=1314776 RepID=A0A165ZCQ9_9AGAM|nr:NAD(P)-binding protein [Sistotremastrum suecicum HHB10207 ss-3]
MSIPKISREYRLPQTGSTSNLTLKEVPIVPPKAQEVLIKVRAVSLQYRDLMVAVGKYPLGFKENVIPGSDMAGEIVALGSELSDGKWKVGDRVCANFALEHLHGPPTPETVKTALGAPIDGVLREYIAVPAHSLVSVPEHLSFEEASTLPCAGLTAYNALLGLAPLKGGDIILVQGTGGVSIFALQLGVASGAQVIVTSSSDEKLEIAKKLGATHTINYKKTPNWDEEVMKFTGGRGVDHVVEVGGPGTMSKSLKSIRFGGYIHVIGFVAGQGDLSDAFGNILGRSACVRGLLVGSVSQFEDMNRLIVSSKIHPVVDKVFGFEETKAAYDYLESQKHVGKVVIKVA